MTPTRQPGSMMLSAWPGFISRMRYAKKPPTIRPTSVPATSECTLVANKPMITPVSRPLIVEPITMPTICERTSGVNSAVRPSKMPRKPPRSVANRGLFTGCLHRFCYASPAGPLNPADPEQQHPNREVGEHEQNRHAVAPVDALDAIDKRLAVRADGAAAEKPLNIGRQLLHALIAAGRIVGARLRGDRGDRRGAAQRVEHHAERVNVGAVIDGRAGALFGRHVRGRPRHAPAECGMRSAECGIKCGVRSAECGIECGMRSAECGIECGMRNRECGIRCGMRNRDSGIRLELAPRDVVFRIPY